MLSLKAVMSWRKLLGAEGWILECSLSSLTKSFDQAEPE